MDGLCNLPAQAAGWNRAAFCGGNEDERHHSQVANDRRGHQAQLHHAGAFPKVERADDDGDADYRRKDQSAGQSGVACAAEAADYVLYINANNPIAIVEAKDNQHAVTDGLQQAMTYAQMLDVPFAYSSNGDAFREHDFLMGTERDIAMEDFPTPDELYARFQKGANGRSGPDAGRGGHHRAAVLFEPEHLSAPLLSAASP